MSMRDRMLRSVLYLVGVCAALAGPLSAAEAGGTATAPATMSAATETLPAEMGRLYPVEVDDKRGFIDRRGKMVIEPRADLHPWGMFCEDGFIYASTRIFDRRGRLVLQSPRPIHNLGRGRFGVAADDGRLRAVGLLEPFASATTFDRAMLWSEGLLGVMTEGKWGYLDDTGKLVIAPQFDSAVYFTQGLASVAIGGQWGYIDHRGALVIPAQFKWGRPFAEGLAPVTIDDKAWYYIDRSGLRAVPGDFATAGPFSEGVACVQPLGSKLYGFIDTQGRWQLEARYKDAWTFDEGVVAVHLPEGKSGYINHAGKFVIEFATTETRLGPFKDGLALVSVGGRTGYIDKRGAWIWSIETARWYTMPAFPDDN